MEFTWKIDKRSRINGLHDFYSHMENKYTLCIIDKMAILSIMVAGIDFYFDKMGKMTKALSNTGGYFLLWRTFPKMSVMMEFFEKYLLKTSVLC
ncbi:hypothetical protein [Streptococcus suis]|uniref:hypothetical protein n=1 Tax=Streptococcus suis TaxID=1307 RepID=UPI000C18029F|nr:hypothetical protein [Streptococcus suis]